MQLRIANAPCSWGVEDPEDGANPPWRDVLDEVARTGYPGIELGPLGFLPEEEFVLRRQLDLRQLELIAGFVFAPLHTPDGIEAALELARRTCHLLASADARHFVIIQGFTPEREQAAGQAGAVRPLPLGEWRTMIQGIHAVARVAADDYGLDPCLHPHAGTYVEFEDEIERVIAETDPQLVSLCIDTGHCAYAGIDPVGLYRRHAGRVTYLHLKDIDGELLRRSLGRARSFEEAVGDGVFCPLGRGVVQFGALREALDEHGFEGWATVEQDRLPTDSATPVEHAAASLLHLREVGLAVEPQGIVGLEREPT